LGTLFLALGCGTGTAQAQYIDGIIKIGVMNDKSGLYSSGPGAVIAARMAVKDSGAATKGDESRDCRRGPSE
jgi:branched-chain amino acid transport system substrate-binding protein